MFLDDGSPMDISELVHEVSDSDDSSDDDSDSEQACDEEENLGPDPDAIGDDETYSFLLETPRQIQRTEEERIREALHPGSTRDNPISFEPSSKTFINEYRYVICTLNDFMQNHFEYVMYM